MTLLELRRKLAVPLMVAAPLLVLVMLLIHIGEQKRQEWEYATTFHGTPEEHDKLLLEAKKMGLETEVKLGTIRSATAQVELEAYRMRLIDKRMLQPHFSEEAPQR